MAPVVTFLPNHVKIAIKPGTTVLAAAVRAGVNIRTRCGGKAGCLMCKITIDHARAVSETSEPECRKMGFPSGSLQRLACQTKVFGDVCVTIPEDPLKAAVRRQLASAERDDALW